MKLVATDRGPGDAFGYSTDIEGNYIVSGAYCNDEKASNAGAAYVFHRIDTNEWDYGVKLLASYGATDDYFGRSVGISGDYVIVGADHEDGNGTDRGAAYIFHRTGTNTWDSGVKLTVSDAEDNDRFGHSVAISGDYAVVGAYGRDGQSGVVYVFHRTGTNTWDSGVKVVPPGVNSYDYFGVSVAIDGDYIVAGAYGDNEYGTAAGTAYVFHRIGLNSWDNGKQIIVNELEAYDWFGVSVGISGDYVIVGAYMDDDVNSNAGAAYIFKRTGTNQWEYVSKMTAPNGQTDSYLGWSASIGGSYAVAGARWQNETEGDKSGATYVKIIQ